MLLCAIALATPVAGAQAQGEWPSHERITAFKSDITIERSGAIEVTETIALVSQSHSIVHGILRDIPIVEAIGWGFRRASPLSVAAVTRDGQPETYKVERFAAGLEITIGDAAVELNDGPHVYTIAYTGGRDLRFSSDAAEFDWNVTGTAWDYPITSAIATVHVPDGVRATALHVVTGSVGEAGTDATIAQDQSGTITAQTTAPLADREGMTINVTLPGDAIEAPGLVTRIGWFVQDNPGGFIGLFGVAALILYARWATRDLPSPSEVIPLFEPPPKIGPADAYFMRHYEFDQTGFAAAVLNLAAQGYVTIEKIKDGCRRSHP